MLEEPFLPRSDARPCFPVCVGILKCREVRGQVGLKALVGCYSPRPDKIKAMPDVWQLCKLTAESVRGATTRVWSFPTPCLLLSVLATHLMAALGRWGCDKSTR